MNKITILKNTLSKIGTYFKTINDNEIIIPCPADCVSSNLFGLLTGMEIIENDEIGCLADVIYIHVFEHKNMINWLVEVEDIWN